MTQRTQKSVELQRGYVVSFCFLKIWQDFAEKQKWHFHIVIRKFDRQSFLSGWKDIVKCWVPKKHKNVTSLSLQQLFVWILYLEIYYLTKTIQNYFTKCLRKHIKYDVN